ncbi:MAG: hypothetical protein QM682_09705 [Paracoccus sp. (in: a-proteobacteria)]|uniref:hypothetical protein n=1 Tax=Paracoccus sp. TaxID=267 RepID=UPI0039E6198E
MADQGMKLAALEGRILAHRAAMTRLIGLLEGGQRQQMLDWLAQQSVMRDGQEDPGAVLDPGAAVELALADEMRLLRERIARKHPAG